MRKWSARTSWTRPCRIYAPVGTHETLLAYLVRRLLENGANSSFVNRIADEAVSIDELIADPVEVARAIEPLGSPHPRISAPADLFGTERRNSAGLDLSNEQRLGSLAAALARRLRRAGEGGAAARRRPRRSAPCAPSSTPPTIATRSARWRTRRPSSSPAPWSSPPARCRSGSRRSRPTAPSACSAPPTSWRRGCRRCSA